MLVPVLLLASAGLIAGLVPGIHMNTFSMLAGRLPLPPEVIAVGLGAAFVMHSASSFLPSIFLGAPGESTALAVLPAHRMLMKGLGGRALRLSLYGLVLGSLFSVLLALPLYALLPKIVTPLRDNMGIILAVASGYMMIGEKEPEKILKAVFVFLVAGLLGTIVLGMPLREDTRLFALLTGAFGISSLFVSSISGKKTVLPAQKPPSVKAITTGQIVQPAAIGTLAGALVGTLPAMSSSVSISLVGAFFSKRFWEEGILVSMGAANVTGFLFSLITLISVGKARNGTAQVISELAPDAALLAGAAGLALVFFAALAAIALSKRFVSVLALLDYETVTRLSLAFLLLLVLLNGGPVGLLIAVTAASIGLLPILLGIGRANVMGMLLLPTILFYMGL